MRIRDLDAYSDKHNIPEFIFVSDSQDVTPIKRDFIVASEFDAFFVAIQDGDYVAVYGIYGVIPVQSKHLYPIKRYGGK